jgi:nitrous oxidase accessory protein
MRRRAVPLLAALLAAAAAAPPAAAREWRVAPGSALATPQAALAVAADGDTVRVAAGRYPGLLVVERRVHLVGEGMPVLDGGGAGTVVVLAAAGAVLEGFAITGSGASLEKEDTGVLVTGAGSRVVGNRLTDVLLGISVQQAPGTVVLHNHVTGKPLDIARRGDAIRVWQSSGTRVEGNVARAGRDVVLWYSDRLVVRGNRVDSSRYGLHFMYCDDADIDGNVLSNNSVGAFLMYSRRLRFRDNLVTGNDGPSGYGLGLKDMDEFEVSGNRFVGNRVALFLDTSPRDTKKGATLTRNLIAAGEVGVRMLPNVGALAVTDNAFVENQQQVERAGGGGDPGANRWHGNYWSDYAGYDADGDGRGDVPYRSERLFEELVDRRPELRLFTFSPAVQAVDFAARAFPLVRPQPNLEDASPRLSPLLPAAAPAPPGGDAERRGDGLTVAAAGGLLGGVLALLAAPGLLLRGRWQRPSPAGTAALDPGRGGPLVPSPAPRVAARPRAVATPPGEPLVQVRGLGKRFGRHEALAEVSFTIEAGEAVALWGANGAGKTTALRALLGVFPFTGEVSVGGLDVRREGRRARRLIGFVPQEIAFPELTAGEALELFAGLHGAPLERLPALVERLGLADELDKRVQTLSGGRKQRLALAVALVADPPLLLLDEFSSNLDAAARRDLLSLLTELKREGKTLVFSSHRPDEVARLADRVLHLEGGRLVADLPPAELLAAEVGELGSGLAAATCTCGAAVGAAS